MLREALNNLADAVERFEFYGDKDNKVAIQQILDAMCDSDTIFRDAIIKNAEAIADYIKEALRTEVSEALSAAHTEIYKITTGFWPVMQPTYNEGVGIKPCAAPSGSDFVDGDIAERFARVAKYYGVHKRSIPPISDWTYNGTQGSK